VLNTPSVRTVGVLNTSSVRTAEMLNTLSVRTPEFIVSYWQDKVAVDTSQKFAALHLFNT